MLELEDILMEFDYAWYWTWQPMLSPKEKRLLWREFWRRIWDYD